jgi:sirohydrochlorin ferrochelatase
VTTALLGQALPPANRSTTGSFLLVVDVWVDDSQAQAVARACAPILGFDPTVRFGRMDQTLARSLAQAASEGASELFVLPLTLEFGLLQREMLGRLITEARREFPRMAIHHDDLDPGDSLVVDCLAEQALKTLATTGAAPHQSGVILAAAGQGDPASRAQSYRLMRLLWERLGLAAGEVGFVRHEQPFLLSTLEKCARMGIDWVIVPQMLWKSEYFDYAEVILGNFLKSHPAAAGWRLAEPPGGHPAITAWLTSRISRLWKEKRTSEQARQPSPRTAAIRKASAIKLGSGNIASVTCRSDMSNLLSEIFPGERPEHVLVKVTWHGYATGTYTDPAALDLLLSALPCPAIVLEGHTSSRNSGVAGFDWETEARENRAWIRQQDAEYLRRTGLAEVMTRHGAQYVNVTESFWDEDCAPAEQVNQVLEERGVTLQHPELAQFVPRILFEHAASSHGRRPAKMISFAKFKGPTRLSIANMFGLLPQPLRAAWHGPNITYMARVCCDLAKLYGALFELYGINEALYSAVRWHRRGLYRSRWGNYDLIENAGYVTASRGLVSADILASRLQGQDVTRSAFFDVVQAELGWDDAACCDTVPAEVRALFV